MSWVGQFWESLGGRAAYADAPYLMMDPKEPRLFHLSYAKGSRGRQFYVNKTCVGL